MFLKRSNKMSITSQFMITTSIFIVVSALCTWVGSILFMTDIDMGTIAQGSIIGFIFTLPLWGLLFTVILEDVFAKHNYEDIENKDISE